MFRSVVPLLATLLKGIRATQTAPLSGRVSSNGQDVSLVREIRDAVVLDVSPDSRRLCIYYSKKPVRSFTWQGQWREHKAPVKAGEDALRLIDVDKWISVYAQRLPALPFRASFFADGGAVYVFVPGVAGGNNDHLLIDVRESRIQEHLERHAGDNLAFSYWAIDDRSLVGIGRDQILNRPEVLVKVQTPEFNEVARVPFAEGPPVSTDAPLVVSSDRKTLVYAYDGSIVCRGTHGLERMWTNAAEVNVPARQLGMSADGALVAVAFADTVWVGGSSKHFISVIGGHDGKELTRVPALGIEGVAISPDGRILAAGSRIPLRDRTKAGTQPTVTLYDIASGKEIASIVQDQFYEGGGEFLYAGVHMMFTPDGRYLITSGKNTKIWQINKGLM